MDGGQRQPRRGGRQAHPAQEVHPQGPRPTAERAGHQPARRPHCLPRGERCTPHHRLHLYRDEQDPNQNQNQNQNQGRSTKGSGRKPLYAQATRAEAGGNRRFHASPPRSPQRNPAPRDATPQEQGQPRRIGLRFLEALLEKDASEVAITLASSPGLKNALAQTAMGPEYLQLLCRVLRKATCSRMNRQSIQQILGAVKESNFLKICLPCYVVSMQTQITPAVRQQYPEHIGNIVVLIQQLLGIFPATCIEKVAVLMSALPASVNTLRALGVDFPEEVENNLGRVHAFIQHLQEKKRAGTLKLDSSTLVQPLETNQGEPYQAMALYPSYNELHHDEKVFLLPNIIARPYDSLAVYLDTHFRLLREDFVRPLREGILQLLHSLEGRDLRKKKFDDIRVYFDARILAPACSTTGIEHKVKFDTQPLKFVQWENSRRLIFGSLVCLSKDNFETFLFATVSNRDIQDLRRGFVQLCFDKHSQALLPDVLPSDSFFMVETTAYFEAYRHVLEGLQEVREEDIPFQRHIIKCESHVREPAYLAQGCLYNLRPLMTSGSVDGALEQLGRSQGEGSSINVLEPLRWPARSALGLDESQMQALQLALTKELALIQGPPGTGKTYVGLKIVKALLSNQAVRGRAPLLIVCYTNHALDQFLEGICAFQTKGIVRVGGRSSSETLKRFNLRDLRSGSECRHGLSHPLRSAYYDVRSQMKESEQKLQDEVSRLECTWQGVLHDQHLRSCIAEHHWDSLARGLDMEWGHGKHAVILEWLGLGTSPFVCTDVDPDGVGSTGTTEEEEEEEEAAADLVAVAGEADLIQAERMLDNDEAAHPHLRKQVSKAALRELASELLAIRLEEGNQGPPDDGGWQVQRGQKKTRKRRMQAELQKPQAMSEAEAVAVWDVWQLDLASRWQLYRHWLHKYQGKLQRRIQHHAALYQSAAERLAELRMQEDLSILKQAQVVGMTTTGAARYRQVLQKVAPRVVIVEEAAEVLEAHTITLLSQACQHLILIGDHQQLRPSANVYDLAKNFNLEVSLFERLVKVGLPFVRLGFQHRMRPEIAELLTPHIYQELENHPSVLQYENIKGVLSNLFFVEHNFLEEPVQEGKSHQNDHEARFVVELCRYFLCQGYRPSQLTILTTYTGQLFCLRKLMPAKTFEGVKVRVVDKYQGEENDIVLLSLVRSNPEGRVGFLQIANRICVALSRAKKGLFCIGNMSLLATVPLWSKILHTLRKRGHVGPSLLLSCQNHPDTKTAVAKAADFCQVPEGGCSLPCDARLSCGHVCTLACHPYDLQHQEFRCQKACQRVLCEDGHRCPRYCCDPCGHCLVMVAKVLPKCGHHQQVPCSTPAETFCCQEPCETVLQCGHVCRLTCGQECSKRCPELVEAKLKCGHRQQVHCWTAADMQAGKPVPCTAPCASTLDCGHACPGSCHSCFEGRFHEPCRSPCKRLLICSHGCLSSCARECPPCRKPCENRCIHSRCIKQCGELCTPCMEPCEWRCQHYQCSQLCSEPCDRPPCNAPCAKYLPCKHPCAGMCGEPCPAKCRVCDQEELTKIFFGFEDEPDACFVQLEDCGHVFESQGLDHYMQGENSSAVRLKVCPSCQTPIRKNLRYGTQVNQGLSEIETVKERLRGSPAEIAAAGRRLKEMLEQDVTLRKTLPGCYKQLWEKLSPPAVSTGGLEFIENLIRFYAWLSRLLDSVSKLQPSEWAGARGRLAQVTGWLQKPRAGFTNQELRELQTELQRLTVLLDLLARVGAAKGRMDASVADQVNTVRQLLEGHGRLRPEDEELVKTTVEALRVALPTSGLGISEVEREQIVAAVTGHQQGHWFKCPQGHIYVITECGGAMERSRCPECQAPIGGTNHTLDPSNQLAPEMDGATHAAWSDVANNLLNVAELREQLF